jgi:hypothetical protein
VFEFCLDSVRVLLEFYCQSNTKLSDEVAFLIPRFAEALSVEKVCYLIIQKIKVFDGSVSPKLVHLLTPLVAQLPKNYQWSLSELFAELIRYHNTDFSLFAELFGFLKLFPPSVGSPSVSLAVDIVQRLLLAFNSAISGTPLPADDDSWLTTMKQVVNDYLEIQLLHIVSRPSITISAVLAPLSAALGFFDPGSSVETVWDLCRRLLVFASTDTSRFLVAKIREIYAAPAFIHDGYYNLKFLNNPEGFVIWEQILALTESSPETATLV